MDLRYTSSKVTDRHYQVTHLKSKRVFDIHRLSPTTARWAAYEVKDGKREKKAFATSDSSRKDLLNKIHNKMYAKPKPKVPPGWVLPKRKPKFQRTAPYKYTPLDKEYLSTTGVVRIRYSAPNVKEKFMIISTSAGWKCTILGLSQQPICIGMETLEAAELELQYYLSPDPQTEEEWEEYRQRCFVRVK